LATICAKQEIPAGFILREEDAKECVGFGMSPEQGVFDSIALSDFWEALYVDGEFAGVWGYARGSLFSAQCFVWLLTTNAFTPHKMLMGRQSVKLARHLFTMYHELQAIVHKDYELSLNWLAWLGFSPIAEVGDYLIVRAQKGDFKWHS
jgi:hypothetical protein